MSHVARIEFSRTVIDTTKPSSITISEDKLLTISLYLNANILEEMRELDPGEKHDYRDAILLKNLANLPIKVKLLKINKDDPGGTLVVEADVDLKVPGTGGIRNEHKMSENSNNIKSN